MCTRRGFTLIELLIGINLSLLLVNLILMSLGIVQHVDPQIDLRQNLNGIIQLRQKLAVCRITDVKPEKIDCTFNQTDYEIGFVERRLVMTPGYVVYLEAIKNGLFEISEHVVTITFNVQGETVHAVIAYID